MMIRTYLSVCCILSFIVLACSQQPYQEFTKLGQCNEERETDYVLTDCSAKILKVNDEIWVLVPDNAKDTRYGICELPPALKVDQLPVVFTGEVKKILPTERLAATPLVIKSLKVIKQ